MRVLVRNWRRCDPTILTVSVVRSQNWDYGWEELAVVALKSDILWPLHHAAPLQMDWEAFQSQVTFPLPSTTPQHYVRYP